MKTRSPNLILAVVAFGVFVAADDLTVVSTMLRQIVFDLEIPLPQGLDKAAWIVNVYLIAYVAVMPLAGRLSDVLGRRAVYMGGMGLFLIGSIWVPLAPDLGWFMVGRILTAVGGGTLVPVAMSVIGDVYPREKRATAMGTLGAIDTAGWVWGPLYGAVLIRFLSWQWQFYLNIPLALLGMAAAWWALDGLGRRASESSFHAERGKSWRQIDWWGAGSLTVALLALNVALLGGGDLQTMGGFGNADSTSGVNSVLFYLIAIVAILIFVAIENHLTRKVDGTPPLIPLTLFHRPNFTPAILINFVVGGVLIIAMVNVPLVINVLEVDVERSALFSGYLLSGMTATMAVMAYIGGRVTGRFGYRAVTAVGLALTIAAFGVMGWMWAVDTPYPQMALALIVLGAGFGLVMAPIGTAVINAAPEPDRGIASGLVIMLRLMGMSVGLAGLTAWGLRRFDVLRTTIVLPDLPFADPVYQQAVVDGLTAVTVHILTETFLLSAVAALIALLISWKLRGNR